MPPSTYIFNENGPLRLPSLLAPSLPITQLRAARAIQHMYHDPLSCLVFPLAPPSCPAGASRSRNPAALTQLQSTTLPYCSRPSFPSPSPVFQVQAARATQRLQHDSHCNPLPFLPAPLSPYLPQQVQAALATQRLTMTPLPYFSHPFLPSPPPRPSGAGASCHPAASTELR